MFDEFYLKNSENSGELGKIFDTLITKKEDLKKFCLNKIKEDKKDISDFFSNLISELQKKYFKDGKFIENLGTYNPLDGSIDVKEEATLKWLANGAIPTDTARNALSKAGIMEKFALTKRGK